MMEQHVDVVVIGGGAAGFFAAVNAARLNPGLTVIILEKSSKLLSKVKVSGGGRCNVTHACFNPAELTAFYPRGSKELRQAFSRFSTGDTVEWFEQRGVELKTEDDGRMFPVTDDSQTIIDCLMNEAEQHGVQVFTDVGVHKLEREDDLWKLTLEGAFPALHANSVVIAAGGGRNIQAFQWIKELGHNIIPPVPSLFTFNMPNNGITKLMGVSVEPVTVKIIGTNIETEGPLLITHWGMSGPAVLKASAFGARELANLQYRFTVQINWLSGHTEEGLFEDLCWYKMQHPAQKVLSTSHLHIPKRLWEFLVARAGTDAHLKWGDAPHKAIRSLAKTLCADEYQVSGKTTFKEEFVTCGGVDLKEIDFRTMQSRIHPGLYFAGEVMDVDGVTGGFNFQNAWTSGFIAASAIAGAAGANAE
jgi:predicted Rossmann fold flavoprotein